MPDPLDLFDSMLNSATTVRGANSMLDLDLDLDSISRKRKKKKKEQPAVKPAEPMEAMGDPYALDNDQQGIVKSLVNTTMSGLGYVADSIDKLGARQVRGLLGGKPRELLSAIPFSDALGITRSEDIVSGGDLIGTRGKPGLHNRILEFGAEVALDPMTYLTLGGSAIGKGGKALKAAGLSDDMLHAGKALNMGKREARIAMSPRQVIDAAADATSQADRMQRFKTAVAGMEKTDVSNLSQDLLNQYLDQRIGGLANAGLPFKEGTLLGTGAKSKAFAKKMDDLGERAGKSFMGLWGKQLFDASVMDAATAPGQDVGRSTYKDLKNVREDVRYKASRHANALKTAGLTDDATASQIRELAEMGDLVDDAGQAIQPNSMVQSVVGDMKSDLDGLLAESQQIGVPLQEYLDEMMGYFPREVTNTYTQSGKRRIHNAMDAHQLGRKDYLRGWTGDEFRGTESQRKIIMDHGLQQFIEANADSDTLVDDLAEIIESNWGDSLIGDHELGADKVAKKLASFMVGLGDEGRAMGGYGNHPVVDWSRRMTSGKEAITRAKNVVDYISDHKNLFTTNEAIAKGLGGDQTVSLKDFLQEIGSKEVAATPVGGKKLRLKIGDQENHGTMNYVLEKLGFGTDFANMDKADYQQAVSNLSDLHIDRSLADDFVRFLDTPTNPKSIGRLIEAMDSFTAMFKAGVLTRPSRYTRDFMSGLYQNSLIGAMDPKDVRNTWDLIHGKEIDVTDIPYIKQQLVAQNLPLNKTNALNEFKSLLASLDIASANTMAPNLVQAANPVSAAPQSIDDLLEMSAGNKPVSFKQIIKDAVPRTRDQWNPFNIRGVGLKDINKRAETVFAPAKAGENLGSAQEALNRISPFLTLLRQGVDPKQARLKVVAAHADYAPEAFTSFEREYLARVFPFYRFTRRQIPFHVQQLMENPGGKLAQTLRGINTMRDRESPLPEHIAQTAAIPIGGAEEGFQRFITGFGLPLEDVFGLLRPGTNSYKTVKGTLQEFAGRLNPLMKAPMELASGTQMFTGRDLEDLRGTLSDIIYNTGMTQGAPDTPILLEQLLSNSPASGILTQARQVLDNRKGIGAKLVNLATGMRTTDTDLEKSRNLAIRQYLEDLLRQDPKVHRFSHLFAPDEGLLSPRNKQLMDLYQLLGSKSAAESRKRKKEAVASP